MTSTKTLLPLIAVAMCLGGCVYEEYEVVEESPRRVYHGGYVERDVVVERRPSYYYDDRPRSYYDDRPRAYGGGGVTLHTTRSYDSRARVYHDHDAHQRVIEKRRDDDDDRRKEQPKKKVSDDRKNDSDDRRFEPRIKTRLDQMHTVIAGPRGQPHKPDKDKDDDKKKKKD